MPEKRSSAMQHLVKVALVLASILLGALSTNAAPIENSEWNIRCQENIEASLGCEMLTEISLENSGRTIAQLSILRLPNSEVVIEQRLPTGAHIPSGVLTAVDSDVTFKPILITCNASWCVARSRATPELIAAMKKGYVLSTIMVDPVSLKQVTVVTPDDGSTQGVLQNAFAIRYVHGAISSTRAQSNTVARE